MTTAGMRRGGVVLTVLGLAGLIALYWMCFFLGFHRGQPGSHPANFLCPCAGGLDELFGDWLRRSS